MKKVKKGIFKGMVMLALLMSMVITVYAQTASITMSYNGTTAQCSLVCTWKTGADSAYAKTSFKSGNALYSLGAEIFGYDKNGALTKSISKTGYTTVTTSTISCTASKFKSGHSILDAQKVVKERKYIDVTP